MSPVLPRLRGSNNASRKSMRILITGGTGYIGSHCGVLLAERGHQVTLYDNLANSDQGVVDRMRSYVKGGMTVILGDVLDEERMRSALLTSQAEVTIHCAGLKSISESIAEPARYRSVNLGGLRSLLKAMNSVGANKLIFSSSASVYGQPTELPITEEAPTDPQSPYAETKLESERILKEWTHQAPGRKAILFRYFNPVGAHHSGCIGEHPKSIPNNLMPILCEVASGLRPLLDIYGHNYATPDGTAMRDYIHIEDLAEAHGSAVMNFEDHPACHLMNIGSSQGVSVLEMVHCFQTTNAIRLPYRLVERRPGDSEALYASYARAHKVLGWKPQRDLASMCASAWNYYQQYGRCKS